MSRLAYCHFCDDVRIELGNKSSLMGLYGGELIVPSFPFVLPKLAIIIFVRTPIDQPMRTLAFEVREGSNVLARHEVSSEELEATQKSLLSRNNTEEPATSLSLGSNVFLVPFAIDGPKVIKASVICDGEEITAGKLFVRRAD
ncbi:hypothetical protein [Paraburkholderia pallida]|uniref:Uncharacterized protein n=1 Tax=Paraburkholderia pallida TaxID=2547399 RepID=A0A4P7D058_9BURK|nr:hypothetical protein [Paraburkholderia pallida]QBR00477.1 hypothetical protein E1956_25925 [Paraburkholderia pallida]